MHTNEQLINLVEEAKQSDEKLNQLIENYKQFMAAELSRSQSRHIDMESDELMTIGMMAFEEAIRSYQPDKGAFISFAKRIINLRAIDYYRKQKKTKAHEVLMESEELKINSKAIESYRHSIQRQERALEIREYQTELEEWNITFEALVKVSPKRSKLREMYNKMAKYLYDNKELFVVIQKKKRLPIEKLVQEFQVNRKKVERGRLYIIANLILMNGKYEIINDYIK